MTKLIYLSLVCVCFGCGKPQSKTFTFDINIPLDGSALCSPDMIKCQDESGNPCNIQIRSCITVHTIKENQDVQKIRFDSSPLK